MTQVICFALIISVCQLVFGQSVGDDERPESFRDFLLLDSSIIDLPRSELEKLDGAFKEEISDSRRKLHKKIQEGMEEVFKTLNQGQRRDLARFLGVEIDDLGKGYQRILPQLHTRTNGEYQIIELLGGRKIVTSYFYHGCSEQRKQIAKAEFDKLLKCLTETEFESQWKRIENRDMILNAMAYVSSMAKDQFDQVKNVLDKRPSTRKYNDILSRWRGCVVTIKEQNLIVESELGDLEIDWGEANGISGWYDFKAIWNACVFNHVTPVYRQLLGSEYDWISPTQLRSLAGRFSEFGHSSAGYENFVLVNNELIAFLEGNIVPVQCSIIPQHFFLSEGPVFFLSRREMVERFSIRESQLDGLQNIGLRVSEELMQLEKELCEDCINSVVDALPREARKQFYRRIQDDYGQTPVEHFSSLAKFKLMGLFRTKWSSREQIERFKKYSEDFGIPIEPIRYPTK